MSNAAEPAESAAAEVAPSCTCATCKRTSEQTRFGSDRYHCLECIATRIREWRRRKRQAAAAVAAAEDAPTEVAAQPPAGATIAEVVRTSALALRVEGYLASSGQSWLEVANAAEVSRGDVHAILMGRTPTTPRPTADALLAAIGAEPASLPSLAVPA